jgi:streptogramin lyase
VRNKTATRAGVRILAGLLCGGAGIAAAQTVNEFPFPTASVKPQCVIPGPAGDVWVAERTPSQIARVTPAGDITEFPVLATTGGISLRVQCVAPGPDSNVWFTVTEGINGQIGYITPSGTVTVLPKLILTATFYSITSGPDGALWITEAGFGQSRIGRMTTAGAFTEYPTPTNTSSFNVERSIVTGPDGSLWFTESDVNKIGRLDPTQLQQCAVFPTTCITEFTVPTAAAGLGAITAGPDGALWFVETAANQIGRMTTDGKVSHEYLIPTVHSGPADITTGPDGNLWFTEKTASRIVKMTTTGVFTEIPLAIGSQPQGIASGPDGNVWFAEVNRNQMGRLNLGIVATPTPTPIPGGSHRGHVTPLPLVSPKPVTGRQ